MSELKSEKARELHGTPSPHAWPFVSDEQGFMHVSFAAVLVLCMTSAFFMIGTLVQWRHHVETQLRLDRCVSETAHELRVSLQRTQKLNQIILVTRVSIAAAQAAYQPEIAAPLQVALNLQVAAQEGIQKTWELKCMAWLVKRGCDSKWDLAMPLPSQPWNRAAPDSVGPQALTWEPFGSSGDGSGVGSASGIAQGLKIQTSRSPRFSAALVSGDDNEGWKSKWTSGQPGSGFR